MVEGSGCGEVAWVRRELGLEVGATAALERLAALGPPPSTPVVPEKEEAAELLRRFGVDEADVAETLAARPDPERTPASWWLLERCCHELRRTMGGFGTIDDWPIVPGAEGRQLYVWVFLATVPELRAFHVGRGVPDEISWASMAELGGQMFYARAITGVGGLRSPGWLTAHFRGVLYRIGRLVYERQRIWFDADDRTGARSDAGSGVGSGAGSGAVPRVGDRALGLHIPRGRLTPESVDRSLADARAFFAACFPDEQPCRYATCVSWVLDPQLERYLAAETNILRFQRRFRLLPGDGTPEGDRETVEAIYARAWGDVGGLPRGTGLERAVAEHLERGGHWYFRAGWFEL